MRILKQMLAVMIEMEKLVVETRLFTMELKLDWTSTSLEISRLGRLKLRTAEQEQMMRNRSETICDPGDDDGGYGGEDEFNTTNLRFPTENRKDEDEPQREEFKPAEVQVVHQIHEVRPQSLGSCSKPSKVCHIDYFC